MSKPLTGFVGWRGMVGSVLIARMIEEHDFELICPVFFSTSQIGASGPQINGILNLPSLKDAFNIEELAKMAFIISCQGGDYTTSVLPALRTAGWKGYWIDAASCKRMDDDTIIILDPVNGDLIDKAIARGIKNFAGGNCTVSLLLLALGSLLKDPEQGEERLVEWITTMTYQAASGAGAKNMKELIKQMGTIHEAGKELLTDDGNVLDLDAKVTAAMRSDSIDVTNFGVPLAGNLIPWIDVAVKEGQSREEWKSMAEANKILGGSFLTSPLPIDGTCVRIGAMRCHSQAVMLKLTKNISVEKIEELIASGNEWVDVVPNNKSDTIHQLTPAAVSGTLRIAVGRIRKMAQGPLYVNIFTVGDQLLWGAAEPLRRILLIILKSLHSSSCSTASLQ